MTPQEKLEQAAKHHFEELCHVPPNRFDVHYAFEMGGLKGMEIQKEIDRQDIERLKSIIADFMTSLNQSGSAVGWEYDPHINAAWARGKEALKS